jgi:hypothetical protein
MVSGDPLDFLLGAEEYRHTLVQRRRLDIENAL